MENTENTSVENVEIAQVEQTKTYTEQEVLTLHALVVRPADSRDLRTIDISFPYVGEGLCALPCLSLDCTAHRLYN